MSGPARPLALDAREVAWRFLVGAGVGALVGLVLGGIGGRLVMLVLRLASDDIVLGIESDDGFEIGRFSTSTVFLLQVAAGLGGATGVMYVVLRSALPGRGRAVVWGLAAALLLGADIVDTDGIDFTALDPKPLAVASFVLLPGLAAFLIAVLVERALTLEPWSRRWLAAALVLGALALNVALAAVAIAALAALGLRRVPALARPVLAVARVAVPVLLLAVSVRGGLDLYRDAAAIL